MTIGFSSSDDQLVSKAERDVQTRLGEENVDLEALGVVSNVFRVANKARYHFERTVLNTHDMSFTAFTTLWVLWIWGEMEARYLAEEAGITKGTLTGVVNTLSNRGLVRRRQHEQDKRLVLISTTAAGDDLMRDLFPRINAEEAKMVAGFEELEKKQLADGLRAMLRAIEASTDA